MKRTIRHRHTVVMLLGSLLVATAAHAAPACTPPSTIREADPREVRAFFAHQHRRVLTFLGYSGAGYEDVPGMLAAAARVLDDFDPKRTLVTIGATADGIGAVYATAKTKGFRTAGIVSTQAKAHDVALSPCVDVVFYVKDDTWGGFLPKTRTLSPTSKAMVESSDVIVAIGGGEVARDELEAAKGAGKRVRFIAADMSHAKAIEKARKKGQPPPMDFRGEAAASASGGAPTRQGGSR
jgi:hypothetical protein